MIRCRSVCVAAARIHIGRSATQWGKFEMDVRISSVHAHGDAGEEYVMLRVQQDCDLVNYMLADTTFIDPEHISNELRHMFWFASKQVRAGDVVVLRTGTGTDVDEPQKDGTTRHRLFWGLQSSVWNDTGDTAILFRISDWETRKAK